jgi:hypothetical protein
MSGGRPVAELQLEAVDLPANDLLPAGGSGPERERWKRDNVARRCWRLVHLDGTRARGSLAGLFVYVEAAEELARESGWAVRRPGSVAELPATTGGLAS